MIEMQRQITERIRDIRNEEQMVFDLTDTDNYRVVVKENNKSCTAYYFSVPVYNKRTGRMLDLKFRKSGGKTIYVGSGCSVEFCSDGICFNNGSDSVMLGLSAEKILFSEDKLLCKNTEILPTINGLAFFTKTDDTKRVRFNVKSEKYNDIRANNKYFAIMASKFQSLLTVSCIGSFDNSGGIVAPAIIHYCKNSTNTYDITLYSTGENSVGVAYEINMHERKMFQDTTVESGNPDNNNVFGSVAFIGNSQAFGQQWLYWKIDNDLMKDISTNKILNAKLHIPALGHNKEKLTAYRVASRFCSYGSNWSNKIKTGLLLGETESRSEYISLDITPLIRNEKTHQLLSSNGMILKPKGMNNSFNVISTGDSFYKPQILEINYI